MTTNRIIMNPGLTSRPLVVSRPGYDALTATGTDEVAFDSSWLEANQILYEGSNPVNPDIYIDVYNPGIGARYYLLVAFPSPGFVPLPLVFRPTTGYVSDSNRYLCVRHNGVYISTSTTTPYRYFITNVAIDE